ncbi:MAG TPA: hypothetical protein VFF40_09925 [Acidimicrobiia bacterium]|nr:hypothetical protein [Acidimicrobiia bacterium]
MPEQGRAIIASAWVANGLFAATAVPVAFGVDAFAVAALVVAAALFLVALGVWIYALALGLVRSARGDNVAVANLFLLQGSVPSVVRRQLFSALAVSVLIGLATAARAPAGLMVPMLPLGLAGMWAARYGTFPQRGVAPNGPARSNAAHRAAGRRDRGRAST